MFEVCWTNVNMHALSIWKVPQCDSAIVYMCSWNLTPSIENWTITVRSVYIQVSRERKRGGDIMIFFLLHRSVKFTFKMCQNQGGHLTFNLIGSFIVQVGQFWCQPTVLNVFVAVLMFQYVQRVPCENISSLGVKAWPAGDWDWKAQFVSWQRPDPSTWPWTWPQQARL